MHQQLKLKYFQWKSTDRISRAELLGLAFSACPFRSPIFQVEERALEVWGNEEALESEHAKRDVKRDQVILDP